MVLPSSRDEPRASRRAGKYERLGASILEGGGLYKNGRPGILTPAE